MVIFPGACDDGDYDDDDELMMMMRRRRRRNRYGR
jgi:hypothetical protein